MIVDGPAHISPKTPGRCEAADGPVYGKPRPAVGFFAGLTDEQKAKAITYRGEENHGDPQFAR